MGPLQPLLSPLMTQPLLHLQVPLEYAPVSIAHISLLPQIPDGGSISTNSRVTLQTAVPLHRVGHGFAMYNS
jgi:hypothetical protein